MTYRSLLPFVISAALLALPAFAQSDVEGVCVDERGCGTGDSSSSFSSGSSYDPDAERRAEEARLHEKQLADKARRASESVEEQFEALVEDGRRVEERRSDVRAALEQRIARERGTPAAVRSEVLPPTPNAKILTERTSIADYAKKLNNDAAYAKKLNDEEKARQRAHPPSVIGVVPPPPLPGTDPPPATRFAPLQKAAFLAARAVLPPEQLWRAMGTVEDLRAAFRNEASETMKERALFLLQKRVPGCASVVTVYGQVQSAKQTQTQLEGLAGRLTERSMALAQETAAFHGSEQGRERPDDQVVLGDQSEDVKGTAAELTGDNVKGVVRSDLSSRSWLFPGRSP